MATTFFGTDGIRGIINKDLKIFDIFKIGCSIGIILKENMHKQKVFLGKDTRISSDIIESALISGLSSVGCSVELLGIVPTPAVAYLAKYNNIPGIVISASHNSYEYNGIKIFDELGLKISNEIEELIENKFKQFENLPFVSHNNFGKIIKKNSEKFLQNYINHVTKVIENKKIIQNINKIKVVFDCSNGASYKTIKFICQKLNLNADIKFNNPNGININDNCGSTHIDALQKIVKNGKYDIGIAFDGDADRCIIIDENSKIINGDKIVAICARYLKQKNKLKNNVFVSTILSNLAINAYAEKYGMRIAYSDVGDKNILNFMLEYNYVLGGEQSGHIIFSDYSTTGDGQLTALQFLNVLGDIENNDNIPKCSELINEIQELPQSNMSVRISEDIRNKIINDKKFFNKIKLFKIKYPEYRIVIRPSGTEPVLRILIEGEDIKIINKIKKNILNLIDKFKTEVI